MKNKRKNQVFILNVSKRIFNVLEKANNNNNNKLIIVEHLVFSQIQRITEYKTASKKKLIETDKGRKRYEKLHPKREKRETHFTDGDRNHLQKSPQSTRQNNTQCELYREEILKQREKKKQQTKQKKGIEKRERQVSIIYINMCL